MVEVYEYDVYPSDYSCGTAGLLSLPVYDLPVAEFACRYNLRTLDGIPLDPITNELIPSENILNINGRCYDKIEFKYANHSVLDPISNDLLPLELRKKIILKDSKVDLNTFPFVTHIVLSNCTLLHVNNTYPNIIILQLSNSNVSNIEFLKYLPAVISLAFDHNSIVDLAPMLYLNNIRSADFSYNSITDISFLDSMSVQYIALVLSCNKIKKLYIPSKAHTIFLDLDHNSINDISELEILGEYRKIYLNLEYNNIRAYKEMFFVNCWEVSVDLSYNKIKEYRYINFKNCQKCTVNLSWNLIACKPSTGKDWIMDEVDKEIKDVKDKEVKDVKVKEIKKSKIKESKVVESKVVKSKVVKSVKISNDVLVYGTLNIGSIIYCESYTLILNDNIFLGNIILEGNFINRLFLSESDNSNDETHTVEIILANNKITELRTNIFSENRTNLNIVLLLQNNNLLSINSLLRNLNYNKVSVDVSKNTQLILENVEYNSIVDEFILVCNNCNLSGNINLKHIINLTQYYINLDNNSIESLTLETIENCINVNIHLQNNKLTYVSIDKIINVSKLLLNLNTNIIENIFLKGSLYSVNRFKIDLDNNKINSSDNIFKLDTTPNIDNVVSPISISQNRKIVGGLPRKTPTLLHSNIIISLPNNPIEIKTKVVKMYEGSVLLTF